MWLSVEDGWLSVGDGWQNVGDGWQNVGDGLLSVGDGWLSCGRWVARLVVRLIATATLRVRIQTSLKNTWATLAKKCPTHSSPLKKYTKK